MNDNCPAQHGIATRDHRHLTYVEHLGQDYLLEAASVWDNDAKL